MSLLIWQVSETLTECRRQLTRVVAVLQEVAAAGAQMVPSLGEQEGLNALKLEDIACKVVEQVLSHLTAAQSSLKVKSSFYFFIFFLGKCKDL